jgi:hypothetical protein
MWSETYTIGHNEVMSGRLAFALLAVLAGCEASLGPDGATRDAATVDGNRADAPRLVDAAPDARVCSGGGTLAPDGSCFLHVTTPVSYAAARTACMALGGHLAYLKDATIDAYAESFIGAVDTWIGGNDIATEGTFVWDDGTTFSFTNWHTGEPNDGLGMYAEDCVLIAGARVGKQWDDRPCDVGIVSGYGTNAYLCQY